MGVAVRRPGGLEVLQLAERPVSKPAAGEALVRVAASGVKKLDFRQRRLGSHSVRHGEGDLSGLEVAAQVAATGPGVASGANRPVVDSRYPLTSDRHASEGMESGVHFGKIVLDATDVALRTDRNENSTSDTLTTGGRQDG